MGRSPLQFILVAIIASSRVCDSILNSAGIRNEVVQLIRTGNLKSISIFVLMLDLKNPDRISEERKVENMVKIKRLQDEVEFITEKIRRLIAALRRINLKNQREVFSLPSEVRVSDKTPRSSHNGDAKPEEDPEEACEEGERGATVVRKINSQRLHQLQLYLLLEEEMLGLWEERIEKERSYCILEYNLTNLDSLCLHEGTVVHAQLKSVEMRVRDLWSLLNRSALEAAWYRMPLPDLSALNRRNLEAVQEIKKLKRVGADIEAVAARLGCSRRFMRKGRKSRGLSYVRYRF